MESLSATLIVWYFVVLILGWQISKRAILASRTSFIAAGLKGNDMGREDRPEVAESLGLISAVVFLSLAVLTLVWSVSNIEDLAILCGALLTITSAAFLGFIDDVLNLKWRHKLWAPAISTLPLISVYIASGGQTEVILPNFLRGYEIELPLVGSILSAGGILKLGPIYYIYLFALIIFCLNSINILAGVNGLEAGQSLVIGLSFIMYNIIELSSENVLTEHKMCHMRSLSLMVPFVGSVFGLLQCNWYPAKVFVGDTFCYWAGCTLAVTSIVGKFSKTGLLFFIPQIFNFLYGLPQLFQIIPCPRHRLPRFNKETKLREMSLTRFKYNQLHFIGQFWIKIGSLFGLVYTKELEDGELEINNLTNLNLTLKLFGQMSERNLTVVLLLEQVFCSFIALAIRYQLSELLYSK